MLGINRALNKQKNFNESAGVYKVKIKPCIFLSHRSLDKKMVIKIGDYINTAGIDTYLDVNDENLQNADLKNDDEKVTECIQKGVSTSTHIMCLISPVTVESWWVPYEVGYGDRADKHLCSFILRSINEKDLPSYIKAKILLHGISDLNTYLQNIALAYSMQPQLIDEGTSIYGPSGPKIQKASTVHPLYNYFKL